MLSSIKRSKSSKSRRYVQLRFEGFGLKGRNKIEHFLRKITAFWKAFFAYFLKKVKKLNSFFTKILPFVYNVASEAKSYIVRKLIWSRGRLGRPVANLIIMSVAFVVFMFGGIFNSSRFVNSQEISPDYLSNVSDIIPKRNQALTLVPDIRKQNQSFTYTIQEGDTLSGIGNKFKISVDALKYVNSLTDYSILKVGQNLTIPPVSGLIHKVEDGDTLNSIATKYSVPTQAIADFNYILDTSTLAVGTELVIPDAKIPEVVPIVPAVPATLTYTPSVAPDPGSGWCVWPTTVRIITQYFSWYHNGLDIATPWGQTPPLFACSGGVVTRAGWDPWGLGLMVQVDHGNGYQTVYGHMSRIDVGYGQEVSRGQSIGLMGNTGRSTGPHVHFIVKYNGAAQNPLNYIQ